MKKYLSNGEKVKLITKTSDGKFLVSVDKVFDNPPLANKHKEFKDLQKEAVELSSLIENIKQKINTYSAVNNLFELINDQVTHFIIIDADNIPQILTKQKVKLERMSLSSLSLFIKRSDNSTTIECKIDSSADNRGKWSNIIPCHSYNEGVQIIKERLESIYDDDKYSCYKPTELSNNKQMEFSQEEMTLIKLAKTYQIKINPNIVKKLMEKLHHIYEERKNIQEINAEHEISCIDSYFSELKLLLNDIEYKDDQKQTINN